MAFLPSLCRRWFDQDLILPSVATWWCGQPSEQKYVLDHLDRLVVRPAFGSGRAFEPGGRSPRMNANNCASASPFARTVSWPRNASNCRPRRPGRNRNGGQSGGGANLSGGLGGHLSGDAGWVDAGGSGPGRALSSPCSAGASKDTWVLADGPVEEISLLQSNSQSIELRRVGNNLPSRLADNYYWLGVTANVPTPRPGCFAARCCAFRRRIPGARCRSWSRCSTRSPPRVSFRESRTSRSSGPIPRRSRPSFWRRFSSPTEKGSLRRLADHLQHLAMLVRDRTANDLWRVLSTVNDRLTLPAGSPVMLAGDAVGVLNQTIIGLASFHGLARENMTRAQGWRFLDMGVRIERCIYTFATFLDCALALAGGRQSQRAGVRARGGRQRHHLPVPVQSSAQHRRGVRPRDARRHQPAVDCSSSSIRW
jgi:hypothetical protein